MKTKKMSPAGLAAALGLACALHSPSAMALTPYIGQIICVGWNFEAVGWMRMEGQALPISEFDALFFLIGTTYGGDGQTTFRLPDLRGRVMLHQGQGPSTSNYTLAQFGGSETKTLTTQNLPNHSHQYAVLGSSNDATSQSAAGKAAASKTGVALYTEPVNIVNQAGRPSGVAGSGLPVDNLKPTLTVNCQIAVSGIFPSSN